MASTFSGDETAPFFGFLGAAAALVFSYVRKPPKDFRQSYFPGKGLKNLLDLPLQKRKAPLLLNFIPTYTSKLADVPKKKKKSASPSTASTEQAASTSEPADQPSTSAPVTEKKRRRRLVKTAEMERPKKVVLDLLADLPDEVDVAPSQQVPPPKLKRVKKAQPKAKATEIDAEAEDAVPISQLAKKTTSAPAKRPAEAQPSGSTQQKRPRSSSATTLGSRVPKVPWEPKITLENRPVYANESADDVNIGVALSTAVLLEGDLERNAQMSGYENYALMLQRSVQAMQHAHSFSMMAFEMKEELSGLKKEFSALQKIHKRDQLKMKKLEDQAEAATKAHQLAQQKAEAAEDIRKVAEAEKKEAEAKKAQAEKELTDALATKDADIKAADAKGYSQGMADVAEDYKLQVKQACNKGFSLGWNALAKELGLPADSPWRKTKAIRLPFALSPPPSQVEEAGSESESQDEDKDEEEALVRKPKDASEAKSPPKGGQVLDLTGDEDLEVIPKKADIGTLSSDLLLAERNVDETLAEIDAEIAADKETEVAKETEVVVERQDEVVEKDAEVVLPEPSEVPAEQNAEET